MEIISNYISIWEKRCYSDGIPEQVPLRIEQLNKAPSYKALVKCILKNDFNLKGLGYTIKKPNAYHELKRIELNNRNKNTQLKLF
jgi:predicted phosphoadenosine phosphosulfate sulfurtransferase